jgi:hypothetical protein
MHDDRDERGTRIQTERKLGQRCVVVLSTTGELFIQVPTGLRDRRNGEGSCPIRRGRGAMYDRNNKVPLTDHVGTCGDRADDTIRDMAKQRKSPCQRDLAWLGRGTVLGGRGSWEWSMGMDQGMS